MRFLLITDAWWPQINGVVTAWSATVDALKAQGHQVGLVTPEGRRTAPLPTYPEIRLSITRPSTIAREIEVFNPDHIHIATEGPLGWFARHHCKKQNLAFTTSYHSRYPEYIEARFPLPGIKSVSYSVMKRFHNAGKLTLASSPSLAKELCDKGFANARSWPRGIEHQKFRPVESDMFAKLPKPVHIYVGRIAVEKNLGAFLDLDLEGSKVIVGDGPQRTALEEKYKYATFTGYLKGDDLAKALTAADVFVFPSKTDTLGLVMLEAMACGLPVAAFPVMGPIDVVTSPKVGMLDEDLATAIQGALKCKRQDCINFVQDRTWEQVALVLEKSLVPVHPQ